MIIAIHAGISALCRIGAGVLVGEGAGVVDSLTTVFASSGAVPFASASLS